MARKSASRFSPPPTLAKARAKVAKTAKRLTRAQAAAAKAEAELALAEARAVRSPTTANRKKVRELSSEADTARERATVGTPERPKRLTPALHLNRILNQTIPSSQWTYTETIGDGRPWVLEIDFAAHNAGPLWETFAQALAAADLDPILERAWNGYTTSLQALVQPEDTTRRKDREGMHLATTARWTTAIAHALRRAQEYAKRYKRSRLKHFLIALGHVTWLPKKKWQKLSAHQKRQHAERTQGKPKRQLGRRR